MSLDPNELFVCNAVKRLDIASELNDTIECGEMVNKEGKPDSFAPDDDRLTGEKCRYYAEALGNLEGDEDEQAANLDEFCRNFLEDEFGFYVPEMSDEDVATELRKKLDDLESQTKAIRKQLANLE